MKVWLSRPRTGRKRHLVLDVPPSQDRHVYPVLTRYVMGGDWHFRRKVHHDKVRYRIPRDRLEAVNLTFPFATLSSGLEKRLLRAETIDYGPPPKLDIPGFRAELYDFQKFGVAELIEREIPLTDGMGLGKTLQALAVICALQATPCLVICPSSAKWVWEDHIQRFTDLECVVVDGTKRQREEAIDTETHVLIINFDSLRLHPELAQWSWAACVVDEFHRLKNPDAQVTQAFQELQADRWIPLSGTPILNRPEESWTILNRLWPKRYPSYYMFCQNLILRSGGKGGFVVGYVPQQMKKLKRFIERNSIRRRKEQVLKELPEVTYKDLQVELLPEQRKLYNQILREGKLQMADGEIKRVFHYRALITRLRQASFSPELYGGSPRSAKLEELKLIVRELVDSHEKAIIYSQWSKATRIVQRELKEYNPAYVDGSVKGKLRREQERKFNLDPECHLYIGTIRANRESITLNAATYVIFLDEDWSPAANDQARDRSASGGLRGIGVEGVTVVRLFAKNTIEQEVHDMVEGKRGIFNVMYERDGGSPIRRSELDSLRQIFEEAA